MSVDIEAGDKNGRLGGARKLDLSFLGSEPKLAQRLGMSGIGTIDNVAICRKLRQRQVHERAVEVAPAEEVVAVVPDDA